MGLPDEIIWRVGTKLASMHFHNSCWAQKGTNSRFLHQDLAELLTNKKDVDGFLTSDWFCRSPSASSAQRTGCPTWNQGWKSPIGAISCPAARSATCKAMEKFIQYVPKYLYWVRPHHLPRHSSLFQELCKRSGQGNGCVRSSMIQRVYIVHLLCELSVKNGYVNLSLTHY